MSPWFRRVRQQRLCHLFTVCWRVDSALACLNTLILTGCVSRYVYVGSAKFRSGFLLPGTPGGPLGRAPGGLEPGLPYSAFTIIGLTDLALLRFVSRYAIHTFNVRRPFHDCYYDTFLLSIFDAIKPGHLVRCTAQMPK